MDSPSVRLPGAPLTPSSYAESPIRKSPRLKQTSTPSNGMAIIDTPSLTNKAFIIANSSSVPSKAKRRLIEDEGSSKNNVMSSPLTQGNAAKRQKTTPKSAPTLGKKPPKLKKRIGQINFGVSHRIRPREKPDRPVKSSSNIITLSDLKKNRSEGQRHPFDPVNKSFTEMHDVVHDTPAEAQVSEKIQPNIENIRPVLADAVSPLIRGMQRTKLQSPTVNLIKEKAATVSPKVITKTWNQRYKKDTRERKFFKSRQSNEENRVVTVSMSENIKYVFFKFQVRFQLMLCCIGCKYMTSLLKLPRTTSRPPWLCHHPLCTTTDRHQQQDQVNQKTTQRIHFFSHLLKKSLVLPHKVVITCSVKTGMKTLLTWICHATFKTF